MGDGAQCEVDPLSASEQEFIRGIGFESLNRPLDERALERFSEVLWNLCLWERQRTTAIETKAAALIGLSTLAAAVVSVGFTGATPLSKAVTVFRLVSVSLFVLTVLLSLFTQRVVTLGGFSDRDVFAALAAHEKPVGTTPKFADIDPYRDFLREVALQRWCVYRTFCDGNDAKASRLAWAQLAAALAVFSLLATISSQLI